ncbi:type IV conjugative transfer system protein TraL [Candidatus Odyssella thessalonicensis]|uniref:type IV conjugative transfer system protein TraL n=1 Tax=Candidatus Odyssella thessalonicensis TaxID=84647 RepID=UPI000225ACDC|nr:type IV conjugative transfer system protein TraL [Candidatus Odyssella thessalonicensis]
MSGNRHLILNHVDSPLKYLLWTKGEVALYIGPLMGGLVCDQLTVGIAICAANYWLNRQYKRRFGKGQFQAVAYWFLPSHGQLKKLPPSHIREYLG